MKGRFINLWIWPTHTLSYNDYNAILPLLCVIEHNLKALELLDGENKLFTSQHQDV